MRNKFHFCETSFFSLLDIWLFLTKIEKKKKKIKSTTLKAYFQTNYNNKIVSLFLLFLQIKNNFN